MPIDVFIGISHTFYIIFTNLFLSTEENVRQNNTVRLLFLIKTKVKQIKENTN